MGATMLQKEEDAKRNRMWSVLIDDYDGLKKNAKKHAKERYAQEHNCLPHEIVDYDWDRDGFHLVATPVIKGDEKNVISLDDLWAVQKQCIANTYANPPIISDFEEDQPIQCTTVTCNTDCLYLGPPLGPPLTAAEARVYNQKQEKSNAMNEALYAEQSKRSYLHSRLYAIRCEKVADLRETFNINDDDAPKTRKELAERIAAGKYQIKDLEKKGEVDFGWNGWYGSIIWRDPAVKADEAGFTAAVKKVDDAQQATLDKLTVLSIEEGYKALEEFKSATFH